MIGAASGRSGPARIGVLGSARLSPNDHRHVGAVHLGAALARAGHIVVTGGYGGIMGGVSRGAAEAGGHVVGLPVRTWNELKPNEWVAEPIEAEDSFARLRLLNECDVLVALSGGIGTLAEVAVFWANLQTDPATTPSLILVDPPWSKLIEAMRPHLVIDDGDLGLVRLASTEDDVLSLIAALLDVRRSAGRRYG